MAAFARTYKVSVPYDGSRMTVDELTDLSDVLISHGEIRVHGDRIDVTVVCRASDEFRLGYECCEFERNLESQLRSRGYASFDVKAATQ